MWDSRPRLSGGAPLEIPLSHGEAGPLARRTADGGCPPHARILWDSISPSWRRLRLRLCRAKIHLGDSSRSLRRFEISVVRFESRAGREQTRGKLLNVGVVIPKRVVVAFALDSDAIFGARKLILQPKKILVRLQLR